MRRENPSYDPFKKYFNTSLPEQTKAERPAVVDEDPGTASPLSPLTFSYEITVMMRPLVYYYHYN